jgi:hypothetical protein
MLYTDYDLAERLMDLHVQEEHEQAELRRLEREARKACPSWVSQQRGRFLCQLDSLVASLVRRLLDAGPSQAPSFEEDALPK